MVRRLRFRHRIGLLLALAAAALVVVTVVTLVFGRRSERQLTGIETEYVPLIELDRDLKRLAFDIAKALEDAAAAGEDAKLGEADQLKAAFLERLAAGAETIAGNGGDAEVLARMLASYYTAARSVSAALVAGAPASELVNEIDAMHRVRREFNALLDAATSPDRERLAAAFVTARESQNESLLIDIVVATVALTVMGVFSWRLIRRTVEALRGVSDVVERLARGEFSQAVDVPPGDEIGDLAREANRTAVRLRDYREAAKREAARAQAALVDARQQAHVAETANKELEAFSYSVSHDLRAPLRGIDGFSQAVMEDEVDRLSPKGKRHLERIRAGAQRMAGLIDDLLRLSRVSRSDFRKEPVDLAAIVKPVVEELRKLNPDRRVKLILPDDARAYADARLIRIVFDNLIGNAWKFTAKTDGAEIEFGMRDDNGTTAYFVRDNGAGFDMKYVDRLFGAFQRLHSDKEFPGTGIGLATVQRIVARHGGRIWVDAAVEKGATFHFTLPPDLASSL